MRGMCYMQIRFKWHRRWWSFKRLIPSNLFGRALLILVLPMVLSQMVIAYVFYERHWSSVSRNMANSVVGDIAWITHTYNATLRHEDAEAALIRAQALAQQLNVEMIHEDSAQKSHSKDRGVPLFPELYNGLAERLTPPREVYVDTRTNQVHVRIAVEDGVLNLAVSRKTLSSPTTGIFMLWMIGSSLFLTMIAMLFLRNQVQPIVTLARAAEQLGLGYDVGDFKPRGASEVRRAGRAFLIMSERIRRHVQSRTEMLAGISHDLRTPLTRMTLEIEMATLADTTRTALTSDIDDMRRMIDEYLDFARGDAGELMEPVDLNLLIADVVHGYKRSKRQVHFVSTLPAVIMIRPAAIRRALTNVIDNALRYGGNVARLTLEQSTTFVRIKLMDAGPGIPESDQEAVFKPFTRLEPSRNSETGGVGLGLSISRAIVQGHGGDISLENQRDSTGAIIGLEVTLRLPRAVQM